VILVHSLGAEVVLQALDAYGSTGGSPVDSLILVQGAIPAYFLYTWTRRFQMLPGPPDFREWPPEITQCRAKYRTAIRSATQLLYTFSANDQVLKWAFEWHERLHYFSETIFVDLSEWPETECGHDGLASSMRQLGPP
jgi:pimeloyl-ACP methyl ester carboxylesterase